MRKTLPGLVVVGLTLALAACGSSASSSASKESVNRNIGATVGLAMPTKKQTRWTSDSANMAKQFQSMGYKTNIQFGDDDAKKQATQIQSMIDEGNKLLVVVAVDGSSLNNVMAQAAAKKIPVIAYDHLITNTPNVDYYATFDNTRVGVQQASMLVNALGLPAAKGPFNLELVAGSLQDNNSKVFFNGSMTVLQPYIDSGQLVVRSGQEKFADVSTENWDGVVAAKRMSGVLKTFYATARLDALLSPNDSMAIELIKELEKAGYGTAAKPLPMVSGQDAEINSLKSIIAGQQTGTVFKDTRELAKVTVQMGNALLTGVKPTVNDTTSVNNGVKIVPTYLLPPIAVNKSNYETLLVGGGYYTKAQLG